MSTSEPAPRAPPALPVVVVLCGAQLALWAATSGPLAYGYMSDEFYYLDCARHLAWGYVDHPPLSIAVLSGVERLLGDSLPALHLVPALALCAQIALTALLARELGGGRVAQSLAALAVFTAPVYQALAGFYSMNAFEGAIWSGAALLLARIANGGDPRLWLALGVVLGLGLQNKLSVLGLGAGLAVGLLLTRERRWLATPWPWACAALAFAIFAPHVAWQVRHDWPTLEFIRNATGTKMVAKSPLEFLSDQLLVMSPASVPLWVAGLVFFFATEAGRRQRHLAWIWVTVVAFLMLSGSSRSNYAAPAYGILLAGGGVAVEALTRRGGRALLAFALALLLIAVGAATMPFAVPLLPPRELEAWSEWIGIRAPRDEIHARGRLPHHLNLRMGWEELREAVTRAADALSPGERLGAVVVTPWFGAAGAVNFFGRRQALPPAVSGHNSYWLWGPGDADGEVAIVIERGDEALRRTYRSVERIAEIDCPFCHPHLAGLSVYVCRGLRTPLDEVWRDLKRFI